MCRENEHTRQRLQARTFSETEILPTANEVMISPHMLHFFMKADVTVEFSSKSPVSTDNIVTSSVT